MDTQLVLAYSLIKNEIVSLNFYCYLDVNNGQLGCGMTKKTVGEIILGLQEQYKEKFVSASILPENKYFEEENQYLIPVEISISEYDEMFNILPPARTYGGYNFEMFMLPEEIGGRLYSHFLFTFEPYTKKRLKAYKIVAYRNDPFHKVFNACPI